MEGPLLPSPACSPLLPCLSLLAHPLRQPAGPGCSLTTGLCMGRFQPYCPLPLLAMTHRPAQAQPPTWPSVTPLACGQLSQGQGQGTEHGTQPAGAAALTSPGYLLKALLWRTQNRTGRFPHLQSPPCWGHPGEPFWGSHQLLHKCPDHQLTVQQQPLRVGASPALGGLLKAPLSRYSPTDGSRRGWGRGV